MSRRSQTRNQFETQLSGTLAAGSYTMAVNSTAGFEIDEPIYLAIDPDDPVKREWVRVVSITGNTFNIDPSPNDHGSDGRNLAGSVGDVEHLSGAKVRSVSTEQIYLDIFQDAEDDELALSQHKTDGGDPHAQAGYLKVAETDALYVQLSGSTLDALAFILTPETTGFVDGALVPKVYVDTADALHLLLDGSRPMTGELDMGTDKIIGLVAGTLAGEAVEFAAMELAIDADILTHKNLAGAHHDKYTDQNAIDAIDGITPEGDAYYTRDEIDALLGALTIPASQVLAGTFPDSYSFAASVGIAGPFNANSTVDFSTLGAVTMLGTPLRISGSSVRPEG